MLPMPFAAHAWWLVLAARARPFLAGVLLFSLVSSQSAESDITTLVRPEVLARTACSTCHLYPDPSLLDREIWRGQILPKMKFYLGIDQLDVEQTKDGAALKASGLFPSTPLIPKAHWPIIERYYLETAPAPTNTPSRNDLIPLTLRQFVPDRPSYRREPPLTTAVHVEAAESLIFFADATAQAIDILDGNGKFQQTIPVGNITTSIQRRPQGFYLGCIGHFFPAEDPRGQIIFLEQTPRGLVRKVIASNLPRVAHVEVADLNNNGRNDLAVSMFGFLTGRFSWFENLGGDQYKEHRLFEKAGAVKSIAHDFNGDGNMDLAVLYGQETEALIIYMNDGKGNFTSREVFRKPPSYGHTSFQLVDFNSDGKMDFLVLNGDNGDYEAPPKPYHGIRIYLAEGDRYKERFFYPLHGAYGAVAADFDEDGDVDIAAISFFPDYEKSPRESFVYLENVGDLKFKASTFAQSISGRWISIAAGDLDGDGDLDLVLGSLIRLPSEVPPPLKELWEKQSPSVLVLKNQLRQPKK